MTSAQHDSVEEAFRADLRRLGELYRKSVAKTWSLRAVGRKIGVAPTTVGEWLKGSRVPQQPEAFAELVQLLCAALAEAHIDASAGGRALLDHGTWLSRHQAVIKQRAGAVSTGVQRAQAATAIVHAEARVQLGRLLDKPRPFVQWNEQLLQVHPAIRSGPDLASPDVFVVPRYVERRHDGQLRCVLNSAAASDQTKLVVVRGESCTGKTRTAFEAVKACLSDWQLVFPKDAESLLALLDADALAPRTVLWLNEFQEFLLAGPTGEVVATALRRRLERSGPAVIMATLWPAHYQDLTIPASANGHDPHSHARDLLSLAVTVDVPLAFTGQELETLRSLDDVSLVLASQPGHNGAVTQTLAASPWLVDRYDHAALPHGLYGKALITAAMDARRLGNVAIVNEAFLEVAAPGYLTDDQRAAADPHDWFALARAYATSKAKGVVAALGPVAHPTGMGSLPGVYRLADYLDHHGRAIRHNELPPQSFWQASSALPPHDQVALAEAARVRWRLRLAAQLFEAPCESGQPGALLGLARVYDTIGNSQRAQELYAQAADAGSIDALHNWHWERRRAGDNFAAEQINQRAADTGDVVAILLMAATRSSTNVEDLHVERCQELADEAAAAGYDNVANYLTNLTQASWTDEGFGVLERKAHAHGFAGAYQYLESLWPLAKDERAREHAYATGADAGHLDAVYLLAGLYAQSGATVRALDLFRRAAEGGHLGATSELAWHFDKSRDLSEAARWYRSAVSQGQPHHLLRLAGLRQEAGDTPGALSLYQEAARSGKVDLLISLNGQETLWQHVCGYGLDLDGTPSSSW